jgi:hypothetical protein
MRKSIALFAILGAAGLQAATAATITTYDRTTFHSALSSATLSGQDFDSLPLGTITTVNGVTYTPSAGTALVTSTYLTTTAPNGLGSTSVGFFLPSETLTIKFNAPISAFALDINTFATAADSYSVTVNDGSGSVIPSLFDVFPNQSTGEFFGFTDSASFDTVVLSSVGGFSYTVDSLIYGAASAVVTAAVPEPETYALMLIGGAALGFWVRRRNA